MDGDDNGGSSSSQCCSHDSSSKVLLHLHRKTVVRSIDLYGDRGGRWWSAMASRGGRQLRVE
jgi:hypothetical protein